MNVPDWYALLLLALAAYRTFRLIGEDTILDRPRHWLVRLPNDWQADGSLPRDYREGLAVWLQCPWCAGFWNAAVWWVAWLIWPHATLVVAALFALSALVGFAGRAIDPP